MLKKLTAKTMKRRLLLSVAMLAVVGALAAGATTAIFFDEEVSSGNTFTAGAIDLTIDNDSYYNGNENLGTTWLEPRNLDDGNGPANGLYLFFDFLDLKPGDWGEDTISLHVADNDSWLCVDVTLTSDNDNGCNEPEEGDGDTSCGDPGLSEGELADAVNFIWWADDGDNVLESDETPLPSGPLGVLSVGETATVALADSETNIWGDNGPLPGDTTRYLGKAWCFGDMELDPVTPGDNSPLVDPGFFCNGAPINNVTQTDSMTANLAFRAVQSRNNGDFICEPPDVIPPNEEPTTGSISFVKIVTNDDSGTAVPSDFEFEADGGANGVFSNNQHGDTLSNLAPGEYLIAETSGTPGYSSDFSSCGNGTVTVVAGQDVVCTVINNDEGEGAAGLFEDGFGNGPTDTSFDEDPVWTEGGEGAEKRNPAGQEESSSPGGDRFAAMEGPDGFICISINAVGFENLSLSYYWRGDDDSLPGDEGIVEYATGGTCAAPTGLTTITTHDMTDATNPPWVFDPSEDMSAVDNTAFLLRFRADTSGVDVDFRVDSVALTGTTI